MAKVYVSSTIADLGDERGAVMEWLVASGHQPVHSYRPDSDTVRDSCLADVTGCDLYVLILGHRYGFQVDQGNPASLSITHLEFRRAKESGVPRIALIRTSVPDIRQSDLLDPLRAGLMRAFEDEVRQEVRAAEFSDLQGLVQGLSTGVQAQLDKSRAGLLSGWTGPVVSVPPLTGLEVARPRTAADIVDLLIRDGSRHGEHGGPGLGAVGLATRVTGATGAGGFGKTSLARLVAHDWRVLDHFSDGVVWVTVGEDAQGPLLADKVNEVTARLTGQRPPLTDPVTAGSLLGEVLAGRRLLLVVDDVWSSGQLQPFLQATQSIVSRDSRVVRARDRAAGGGPALLVTTRRLTVLPEGCGVVTVDAMAPAEADELLTRGLPGVEAEVVRRALRLTGRWPVLLGLINGTARADVRLGAQPGQALADIADQIAAEGPNVLDLADAAGRELAVGATLQASLDRITADQQARYAELAVFGEDVDIPRSVLERYWAHTAGWRPAQVHQLCSLLLDVGLAAEYRLDEHNPRLRLHDVIRAWLRHRVANPVGQLDGALVDSLRGAVSPECAAGAGSTPWWRLHAHPTDPVAGYVSAWLPRHLAVAGATAELTGLLQHPGWILGQLAVSGPPALESDLLLSDDHACQALARVVRQDGHLLGELDPPGSLAATLASRCDNNRRLAKIRTALIDTIHGAYLEYTSHTPDLPHPNLHRVLSGHTSRVDQLVVAPDGTWLASAGDDMTIRIWDRTTGAERHTLTGHTGSPDHLMVAPDGTWLASASDDTTIRIWDLATGAERHTLTEHTDRVNQLVVAPDGTWLASTSDDTTIRIWDLATGAERHTLTEHTDRVNQLVVAPDGTWLASTSDDTTIRIWDLATGAERHTLTEHTGPADQLVVAPDGTWLASAGEDRTVRIWDPATGAERHSLSGHTGWVRELLVAPDSTWLASAGDDTTIRIWDPATGAELHTLTGHNGPVYELRGAPDGAWFASTGWGAKVRIWDPAIGAIRHTLTGHTDTVRELLVAPDGTWLASAGEDATVRIWDPNTGAERHTLTGHTDTVRELLVAPDGTWLASAGEDATVRIWNPAASRERHTLTGHTDMLNRLLGAPEGSWLATAGQDSTVRIWDPTTASERHTLNGHSAWVHCLLVSPDGTWLASAGEDATVRIWDPDTGAERHTLAGHTDRVYELVVAPDGTWLASAGQDATVRIWDSTTGAERHTLTGHAAPARELVVAPDGTWLASASSDATVRIWDPDTGAERHTLTGHTAPVRELVVAPDGTWLASASSDATVRIWDPDTGAERHTLTGHTAPVRELVVAPDGTWLASASSDATVRIWDPDTGAERHTLTGHTAPVRELVVAPDGTWLASAGEDATVRIWDPNTGAERHTLTGHTAPVYHLLAAPDGTWLASAGEDATIRIWNPATGLPVAALRTTTAFTSLTWTRSGPAAIGARFVYMLRVIQRAVEEQAV